MDYKKMQADKTTVTHDVNKIDAATNNIYEALTMKFLTDAFLT